MVIHRIPLQWSALSKGPATIACRLCGDGPAIVFLHGGWGYDVYPFDVQFEAFGGCFKILAPDRSGYGGSTDVAHLGPDFHHRALLETLAVLDEMGVERPVWWGHSDGAVIAALAGIHHPDRCNGVILEALHLYGDKPGSRSFFEKMAHEPDSFGPTLTSRLAADHGEDRWRRVLEQGGLAWLEIAARSESRRLLYDGRLDELGAPTMLIYGGRDPRGEPGEWEAIREALPHATTAYYPSAGHSPHSEPDTADEVTSAALRFVTSLGLSPI